MKKLVLAVLSALAMIAFIAARREVQRAETEAALWAEATDPLD